MKMQVIVDDHECDAVASVVESAAVAELELITLSQLFECFGVYFDVERGVLDPAGLKVPNEYSNCVLLNRVVSVSNATLRSLDHGTETLESVGVLSVLEVLLAATSHALGSPGMFCGAGAAYPLHLQYGVLDDRATSAGIHAPQFHLASRGEDPQTHAGDNVIAKSVWDLSDWRSGSSENPNDPNAIYITKPQGCAEVYYFIGDAIGGFDLTSGGSLDTTVREQARPWIESLRKVFFATCGEVLTVRRTGDDLVFLSFVHTLATSAEDAEFYEVVLQGLTGIMDRVVSGSEKNDEASDSADCVTAYITAID